MAKQKQNLVLIIMYTFYLYTVKPTFDDPGCHFFSSLKAQFYGSQVNNIIVKFPLFKTFPTLAFKSTVSQRNL